MAKTNEEIETHLSMTAANRKEWSIFTEDIIMQRKLERIGATLVREAAGGGKFYTLPARQVSFRKPKTTQMSEERKEELRERMKKIREAQRK